MICINFYEDTPLSETFPFFEILTNTSPSLMNENFADDVDNLIEQAYTEAYHRVMPDESISSSLKNKEIISILYNQGIFRMKDAVVKVAKVRE